jgi:hypothetical protein
MIAPSRTPAQESIRRNVRETKKESVARRYSPGGDTVILAANISSGSKITVQIPKQWQAMAANGSVESQCRPGLAEMYSRRRRPGHPRRCPAPAPPRGRAPERKSYRVGPKFSSWPNILTVNPY